MFLLLALMAAVAAAAAAQADAARSNEAATRRAAEEAAGAQRNAAQADAESSDGIVEEDRAVQNTPSLVAGVMPVLRRVGSRRIPLTGILLSLGLLTMHFVFGDNPPQAAGDPDLGLVPTSSATATRTPTPPPTRTPTPTPTLAPARLTISQNANCRKGPGVAFNIVTSFVQGTELIAVGRNEDATWWYVEVPEGESCWVGDVSVDTFGPFDALPIIAPPPLPESPYVFYDETICTKKVYKVTLYWQDVSDEVGYHIYRNGVFLDAVERNRTKFINYVPFGQDLVYELESFNENGVSERLETTVLACTK